MRHKGWKYAWLALLMGGLIVGYGSVSPILIKADDSAVGVVTQLIGEAWMLGEMGELIPLEEGMIIAMGVELKTAGILIIKFNDGSTLMLKPNTEIAISGSGELRVSSGSAEYTSPGGNILVLEQGGRAVNVSQAVLDLSPTITGVQLKVAPIFPYSSGGAPEPIEPASPSQ